MSAVPPTPMNRRTVPWYPVTFAAAYVINLWVDAGVSVMAVGRPLAMATLGTLLLLLLAALMTRQRHAAGALALVVLLVLLSRGPLYVLALLVLLVATTLALRTWGRIRRRPITWPEVTAALNVVGGLLLFVVLAGGLMRGTFAAIPTDLEQGEESIEDHSDDGAADLPNIYVLLLDGYPRADSFARLFGEDNEPFIDELRERGFTVAGNSESNYMFTQLTLTSMLQMKPLSEIPALDSAAEGKTTGNLLMRQMLNDNPVFDILRGRGYRVVTSSSGMEHVGLRQTDVYLDEGQLNEFEYQLLRFTTVQRIVNFVAPDFFADQQRDRIRSGLEHYADVATGAGGPTFALIHVFAPHLPVVFEEDGTDAYLEPSEDIFDWAEIDPATRAAYANQLVYLNRRVIDLLDMTIAADTTGPEPIMIVMSDHGAAPRPPIFIGQGSDDHYANFFAARIPGEGDVFGDDITPVNIFPAMFNAVFDMDLAQWPNERYGWVGDP